MSLSDWKCIGTCLGIEDNNIYFEENIKEAVKKDTELIGDYRNGKISFAVLMSKRKEIFGKDLI